MIIFFSIAGNTFVIFSVIAIFLTAEICLLKIVIISHGHLLTLKAVE